MGNSLVSSGYYPEPFTDEFMDALEEAERISETEDMSEITDYRNRISHCGDGFPIAAHLIDGSSPLVLLFGGVNDKEPPDRQTGRSVFCYYLQTHQWKMLGKMPAPRQHHAACLLNNKVYITGGINPVLKQEYERISTSTTFELDLVTGQWKQKFSMWCPRSHHAMAAFNDLLYVFGGKNDTGRIISQIEAYSPEKNSWISIGIMPVAAMGLAVTCFRNKIWLIGGLTTTDGRITEDSYLDTVFTYDPLTDRWEQQASLLGPRAYAMATTVDDSIWLFGGAYGRQKSYDDVRVKSTNCIQIFDYSTNSWRCIMNFDSPRYGCALAKIGSHVFILGGAGPTPWDSLHENCIINTKDKALWYGKPMPESLTGTVAIGICSDTCEIEFAEIEMKSQKPCRIDNEHHCDGDRTMPIGPTELKFLEAELDSSRSEISSTADIIRNLQQGDDMESVAIWLSEDSQGYESSVDTDSTCSRYQPLQNTLERVGSQERKDHFKKDVEYQHCMKCHSRGSSEPKSASSSRDERNSVERTKGRECLDVNELCTSLRGVEAGTKLEKDTENSVGSERDESDKEQQKDFPPYTNDGFDSSSESDELSEDLVPESKDLEVVAHDSDENDEEPKTCNVSNRSRSDKDCVRQISRENDLRPTYSGGSLERTIHMKRIETGSLQYLETLDEENEQVACLQETNLVTLPKELTYSREDLTNEESRQTLAEADKTTSLLSESGKNDINVQTTLKDNAESHNELPKSATSGKDAVYPFEKTGICFGSQSSIYMQMVNSKKYSDDEDAMTGTPNRAKSGSLSFLSREGTLSDASLSESEDDNQALSLMDPNLGVARLLPIEKSSLKMEERSHSMPSFSRELPQAASIQDTTFPTVLVIGGMIPKEAYSVSQGRSLIRYHPVRKMWEFAGMMPQPRNYHAAILYDGCVYLSGGFDPSAAIGHEQLATRTMICYNLEDGSWSLKPVMSQPRAYHAMAELGGSIYIVGGRDHKGRLLDTVEKFDPYTSTWHTVPPLPRPSMGCAVVNFHGELWSIGGITKTTEGQLKVLQSVCRYDPKMNRWQEYERSLSTPRAFFTAAVVGGSIWLYGGCNTGKLLPLESLDSVEVLAGTWPAPSWKICPSMSSARHAAAIAVLGRCAFIIGGMSSHIFGASAENEHYNCDEKKRSLLTPLPVPLTGAAAVIVPPKLTSLYSRESMESLVKGLVLQGKP